MANEKNSSHQSIRQVAAGFISELYLDDTFDVFRLDLPAQATLADHATGPRIIILLTDLGGKRLADQSEFAAPKGHVLYLTNSFSPGFINHTEHMVQYLVIGLQQGALPDTETVSVTGQNCSTSGMVVVCSQGGHASVSTFR